MPRPGRAPLRRGPDAIRAMAPFSFGLGPSGSRIDRGPVRTEVPTARTGDANRDIAICPRRSPDRPDRRRKPRCCNQPPENEVRTAQGRGASRSRRGYWVCSRYWRVYSSIQSSSPALYSWSINRSNSSSGRAPVTNLTSSSVRRRSMSDSVGMFSWSFCLS